MGRGDSDGSWTTVESDPGVFTELIEKIGVTGVQVEELWSTDYEALAQLSPVFGLVFLFKYVAEKDSRPVADDTVGRVFFANQVIPNACATQAILSILLNIPPGTPGVDLGQELEQFRAFTADLPPDMKGLAISNSDTIRAVHNSFARPESLVPDDDHKAFKDDEAFHFIAYLRVEDALYELDGLKPGPIRLATNMGSEADWLRAVGPFISQRMEQYAASEVRFNLMALCADRRQVLSSQAARLREQLAGLQQQPVPSPSTVPGSGAAAMDVEGGSGDTQMLALQLQAQLDHVAEDLASEHAKRTRWHNENVRRRHNYIPLLFTMLQALAKAGQLGQFIQAARNPETKKARTHG